MCNIESCCIPSGPCEVFGDDQHPKMYAAMQHHNQWRTGERWRDEFEADAQMDNLPPIRLKLVKDNSALMECFGSLETAETSIKHHYEEFEKQICAGWWHPRDLNGKQMRRNFVERKTGDAPTAWLICNLVLTGSPDGSGTLKERQENKRRTSE